MTPPTRIQRQRRRTWRMPEDAVYVGRSTRWGNPYWITRSSDYHGLAGSWFVLGPGGHKSHPDNDSERSARQLTVDLFAADLERGTARVTVAQVRTGLAGSDLVCWCPLDEPCHADLLLRVANDRSEARPTPVSRPAPRAAPRRPATPTGGD